MGKGETKCSEKKCGPTSDNSEACYRVKCEPKCEKECCIKECKCYRPEELVCLYKDAVVEVHSEFILLGANAGTGGATGGTPIAPDVRTDVILEGNGFFIKGHYIVAPAHLVLLPPSLTSVVNRYPYFSSSDLALGTIRNQMVRASRILVSVFNVNGKKHSFIYEADLVGVDGAGDIAVLRINPQKQYNLCNPCIEKCHPYFNFGSSRGSKDGEKVYLIGDYVSNQLNRRLFNAVGAISEGLLSDHRYLDYSGFVLPECVLVSAPAYSFSSGLPILNCQGQVIGMQTTDLAAVLPRIVFPDVSLFGSGVVTVTGDAIVSGGVSGVTGSPGTGTFAGTGTVSATGTFSSTGTLGSFSLTQSEGFGLVSGPSEYFMRRVVKSLIRGTCSKNFNCQLETVCDPVGSYYRYRKSYIGLAYDVFNGANYDSTFDFTSGVTGAGLPRIRLSPSGDFLSSPSCKELIGIRVLGLAGINPNDAAGIPNGYWFVPGGTASAPLASGLPVSPLLGKLAPGDVITHFRGVALGDLNYQIAPSLVTWRLCAGDQLEICYRRGGNIGNTGDNAFTENYDNILTHTICLSDFPALLDYPWYAVNIFPLLAASGFTFPEGQAINPQYPSLIGGGLFHPAL